MGLFGIPYEADPTGALLGQNYNAQTEQEQKIWGLLGEMGQGFLHPAKGAGDLGVIGDAVYRGSQGMEKAGTDYLATAMSRQKEQERLRSEQQAAAEKAQLEKDAVQWMGQFDPAMQKAINSNPIMAKEAWDAFLKAKAARAGSSGSSNSLGAGQPYIDNEGKVHWFQPSLDPTGQAVTTDLPEGANVGISPKIRGDQKAATTFAEENTKKLMALPNTIYQSEALMGTLDDIKARPDVKSLIGANSLWKDVWGTETLGLKKDLDKVGGQLRLQALALWKGMGQFTEAEGQASVDAASALAQSENPQDFFYNLELTKYYTQLAARRAEAQIEAGDTSKVFSEKLLMRDYPKPKRADFGSPSKKEEEGTAIKTLEELKKKHPELFPNG